MVLFLPLIFFLGGLVMDAGLLFATRAQVHAAADLGALSGAQELDWDQLARGVVRLSEPAATGTARRYTALNLTRLERAGLIAPQARIIVITGNRGGLPSLRVRVDARARLRWLAPIWPDAPLQVEAEAAVVRQPGGRPSRSFFSRTKAGKGEENPAPMPKPVPNTGLGNQLSAI